MCKVWNRKKITVETKVRVMMCYVLRKEKNYLDKSSCWPHMWTALYGALFQFLNWRFEPMGGSTVNWNVHCGFPQLSSTDALDPKLKQQTQIAWNYQLKCVARMPRLECGGGVGITYFSNTYIILTRPALFIKSDNLRLKKSKLCLNMSIDAWEVPNQIKKLTQKWLSNCALKYLIDSLQRQLGAIFDGLQI